VAPGAAGEPVPGALGGGGQGGVDLEEESGHGAGVSVGAGEMASYILKVEMWGTRSLVRLRRQYGGPSPAALG
jgi:hypothetical protein